MIYAIMTFIGILFLGGVIYFAMDWTFNNFYDSFFQSFGIGILSPYSDFISGLYTFMPVIIVVLAIISAVVIELRSRNPNAYYSF